MNVAITRLEQRKMINRFSFLLFGIALAAINLILSFYFREHADNFSAPTLESAKWFFIAEPVFNWGGFFVDGSEPSIHRLPTTLFLIWASVALLRYGKQERGFYQNLFSAILLGGVGGLTLDILAYGSVCDWLGFSFPSSPIYSMLNISDLMILFAAPVAAIICIEQWFFQLIAFSFAIAVIGANTYRHLEFLIFF